MVAIILALLLSSSFLAAAAAAAAVDIPVGSSLSAASSNPWFSPSRRFAFGFYREGAGFRVGIWLESSRSKTVVVWTANYNDTPVSADSSLALTKDGLLLQRSHGAKDNLISAQITPGSCSSASLLDSGNLVLYNSTNHSTWESFDYPTDTILGGQTLSSDHQLFSSATEEDHSKGRFRLAMQIDSNLVLYPVNAIGTPDDSYWNTATWGNVGWELHLYKDGSLFLVNRTGSNTTNLGSLNASDGAFIHRATLDTDGIFRLYSHSSSNGSLARAMDITGLEGTCNVKGFCGSNSYCSLVNDDNPKCFCPPGYIFRDPTREFNGCRPNFTRKSCGDREIQNTTYAISTIDRIAWKSNPYSVLPLERDGCKDNCLNDCDCDAALYQPGKCSKFSLPLVYGANETGPRSTQVSFMKIGLSAANGGNSTADSRAKHGANHKVIIIACVLASCLMISLVSIACFLIARNRARRRHRNASEDRNVALLEEILLRAFSYDELVEATHNFREVVGSGGFGTVYKGSLYNGERNIAVKRLEKVAGEGGERQFRAEMRAIGRTHHKNLVRLLGFCDEGSSRLLVYEYMSNGSLADLLFRSKTRPEWSERVRIVLEVARGISYLHEDCDPHIIHCDIKPQNILMDEFWTAKISDFGLAKLLMPDQSRTQTRTRGTTAYLAPEWRKNSPISVKVDVYSFGIVLLETVCCRRNLDADVIREEEIILWEWAYNCLVGGALTKLLGDEEEEVVAEARMLERMVKVGLWCIQDEPALRPPMKHVVLMLEGNMETPLPPSPFSSGNIL